MAKDTKKQAEQRELAQRYSVEGRKRRRTEGWSKVQPGRKRFRRMDDPGTKAHPAVLEDCGGRGCKTPKPKGKAPVNFPRFNYTTPSVFKGRRDKANTPKGAKPPCYIKADAKLKPCAMNLVAIDGQHYLRLCSKRSTPGYLVHVKNAKDAARKGAALCACKKARGSYEACVEPDTALGGLGRARGRRR